MPQDSAPDTCYRYDNADLGHAHDYLLPTVLRLLDGVSIPGGRCLFELGCGNGSVARVLTARGWDV